MRDYLFQITTFIEPTTILAEKAELPFAVRRGVPP
jgi:hypothetical protein